MKITIEISENLAALEIDGKRMTVRNGDDGPVMSGIKGKDVLRSVAGMMAGNLVEILGGAITACEQVSDVVPDGANAWAPIPEDVRDDIDFDWVPDVYLNRYEDLILERQARKAARPAKTGGAE